MAKLANRFILVWTPERVDQAKPMFQWKTRTDNSGVFIQNKRAERNHGSNSNPEMFSELLMPRTKHENYEYSQLQISYCVAAQATDSGLVNNRHEVTVSIALCLTLSSLTIGFT